jgi:hypothetical protein
MHKPQGTFLSTCIIKCSDWCEHKYRDWCGPKRTGNGLIEEEQPKRTGDGLVEEAQPLVQKGTMRHATRNVETEQEEKKK